MEYLLGALVVAVVLAFVVLPLIRGAQTVDPADLGQTPAVERAAVERAEIYRELVELELDQRVGKLAEADYREISEGLLARAAALISEEDAQTEAVEEQVEREIAAMRHTVRPSAGPSSSEARS